MKDRIELNAEAIRMRRALGADTLSPVDIFALVGHSNNLTLVFFPMGQRFSGMSVKAGSHGLIAVNSKVSYGRQRLACAHELYHLNHAADCERQICLLDLADHQPREQEANLFASYFLAPYDALHEYINQRLGKDRSMDVDDIVRTEQYFGFSRRGMLHRLVTEGYLDKNQAEVWSSGMTEQAARLGFDTHLYSPAATDRTHFTMGTYIRLAEDLKDRQLITPGKYEELMLAAFRADMVFGTEGDDPPDD